MSIVDIKSITEDYIKEREEIHQLLLEAAQDIGSFECKRFDFQSLTNEDLDVFKKKNVLYLFRITNSKDGLAAKICDKINELKNKKSFKPKLPKVNGDNTVVNEKENDILYLGKSSGYFNTRLKQHLGNESEHTYALHLKRWLDYPELSSVEVEMCWTTVEVAKFVKGKKQGQQFLEDLESGLHHRYKPILGRTGH